MDFLKNVKTCKLTNAHGEVNFFRIIAGETDLKGFTPVNPENGEFIVGHSESGHNHIMESDGVELLERTEGGMKILYALLKKSTVLKQKSGDPHKQQIVEPGVYLITNNVEYDPFLVQARRVQD